MISQDNRGQGNNININKGDISSSSHYLYNSAFCNLSNEQQIHNRSQYWNARLDNSFENQYL